MLTSVDFRLVQQIREQRGKKLERPYYQKQARAVEQLPTAQDLPASLDVDLESAVISIGHRDNLTHDQYRRLELAVHLLAPWRKGPFRLFDLEIDTEWRSNLKWDRILPALGSLEGKQILDVGCGNGYYMFRAAHWNPRLVMGLDPSIPFYLTFEMIQRFLQRPELQYEIMGVEELDLFDRQFDMVWCMGILYHHRNPIAILQRLNRALRVGGTAIIESQTIPGDDSMALFPEGRYAKARNVYFVPTANCLMNWIRRSGFKNVELVSHVPVTVDEQRSTEFMAFQSLADFLDPQNPELTVEGHPAPWRTVVRAERRFL